MKLLFKLIILTILSITKLYSQTDSVYVETAKPDSVDAKYERAYRLFIDDKREVKRLWKLDLLNVSFTAPNIGLEQKIGRNFSSDTYLRIGYDEIEVYGFPPKSEDFHFEGFGVYFKQEFKYYHTQKRRERLSKRTNGFVGNYMSLAFQYYYKERYADLAPNYFIGNWTTWDNPDYLVSFQYGIQRRIGNVGYIELYVTQGYHITAKVVDMPCAGLKVGFAIDSFKIFKRP